MSRATPILIVDDDIGFRKTLAGILSAKGYTVVVASNGREALAALQESQPAVALIDLRLGDTSGLEVMRELRHHTPDTECIILTGYASQASAIEAINLGAYGYLQKPYNMEQLLLTVRRAAEKRQTRQALRESEERFRVVTQTAHDAIIILDSKARITFWNNAAQAMFGYSPEEVIGKPVDLLIPERFAAVHQHDIAVYFDLAAIGAHDGLVEGYGRRKDGSEFPLEHSLSRWNLADETYFTVVIRDISERKQAKAALQQTNRQLQAALAAKEQMLQNVSHELRTPLAIINGYVQLLRDQLLGPLTEDQVEAVMAISRHGEQLHFMVERLLVMQGLDESVLQVAPRDLTQWLEAIKSRWRDRLEGEGLTYRQEIVGQIPAVVMDESLMDQVIDNLLDNARKFSPHGGEIFVRVWHKDDSVLFSVADQGIGIPSDRLKQVFDLFYQVDGSLTREFGGLGIGLALCRRIVQAHHGRIWAHSEGEGRGSTFYVALPLDSGGC